MIRSKKGRVVVAMSGGVDSSVAAAVLKRRGFDVIGISMRLWPKEECGFYNPTSCCSLEGISDARLVSERLGIPFYVLDFHKEFKAHVIDYFTSEYMSGRTPNPCILCNERIKFGALLQKSLELEADYVATGHYARVIHVKKSGRSILKEGKDVKKDQSYALFSLTHEQLSRIILPLGPYKKERVRKMAKAYKLPVHSKPDSQEICFIQDSYMEFLKKRFGSNITPGPILDTNGKRIGTHKGIPFYTLGQREGLGIAYSHALYVIKIDPEANTIVVGPKESRFFREAVVGRINWICNRPRGEIEAYVKIRSQHKKSHARLVHDDGKIKVMFTRPQESPTPGQAAVFYNKDVVLGGGWIEECR